MSIIGGYVSASDYFERGAGAQEARPLARADRYALRRATAHTANPATVVTAYTV